MDMMAQAGNDGKGTAAPTAAPAPEFTFWKGSKWEKKHLSWNWTMSGSKWGAADNSEHEVEGKQLMHPLDEDYIERPASFKCKFGRSSLSPETGDGCFGIGGRLQQWRCTYCRRARSLFVTCDSTESLSPSRSIVLLLSLTLTCPLLPPHDVHTNFYILNYTYHAPPGIPSDADPTESTNTDYRSEHSWSKYPWIVQAHRFAQSGHFPSQADIAKFVINANAPPGEYIMHWCVESLLDVLAQGPLIEIHSCTDAHLTYCSIAHVLLPHCASHCCTAALLGFGRATQIAQTLR